ncbi:MAG: aromatic aminobenezylarsenical efflux permease ArsG family transporter [bacterium]|nr:aromatic aminobenezylarsenical efflux permease ArsG family transporter [bacterium]
MELSFWAALGSAFWLGILTSISPCPLATNIAAMTFIGKRVDEPGLVLKSGLAYILGRMVSYIALAAIIVFSFMSVSELAMFLQLDFNKLIGPILIVVSLLLFDLIPLRMPGFSAGEKLRNRLADGSITGSALLGLLFALSFCPISAALYFGSLIPLAIDHSSAISMPVAYAVGSSLPVVLFAVLISFFTQYVSSVFDRLRQIAIWAKRITALVFLLVGIYYLLVYNLGIQI